MADPQLENGYTATANELLEAECQVKMSGSEWQVYHAIKRLTYGWHKKRDRIAYSQIVTLTGLRKNQAADAVKGLIIRGMVLSQKNGTHTPQTLGINKDFSAWKLYRKQGIPQENGTGGTKKVGQKGTKKAGPPKKESKVKEKTSLSFGNDKPPVVFKAQDLFDLWNGKKSDVQPLAKILTASRRTHANARLKEQPTRKYWEGIMGIISDSPWCNGDNQRGWKASFDFLLQPNTHVKAIEGAYQSSGEQTTNGQHGSMPNLR